MGKRNYYYSGRIGFIVVFLIKFNVLCYAQNFKNDPLNKIYRDSIFNEFQYRLYHFLTDVEFNSKQDSISVSNYYPWQKRSSGISLELSNTSPFYVELRNNKWIPHNVVEKICDKEKVLKNDFYNHSIFFNQCRNLDAKIHFKQIEYLKYTSLFYYNTMFLTSDITDDFILPRAVNSLTLNSCVYNGSLVNVIKKDQLNSFTRIDCNTFIEQDEIEAIENTKELRNLHLEGIKYDFKIDISKIEKLQTLRLNYVNLKELPKGLDEMLYLYSIDLSNNRLSKFEYDFKLKEKCLSCKYDTIELDIYRSKMGGILHKDKTKIKKQILKTMIDTIKIISADTVIVKRVPRNYNLNYLNLSDNCLVNNSINLKGCNVQEIHLEHNLFTKPPRGIYGLPKSTYLYLDQKLEPKVNKIRLKCSITYIG